MLEQSSERAIAPNVSTMPQPGDEVADAVAAAVSLKLPEFYSDNPDVWFVYCDAQFQLRNITSDDTKFAHIVLALPQSAAARVHELLTSPPATDKYKTLKAALLEKYTLSTTEKAATLLDMAGLGERKPSDLLAYMQSCHPKDEPFGFLSRELFLRQLPLDVRAHLADKQQLAMAELAKEADQFFTSTGARISATFSHPAAPVQTTTAGLCYYHDRFGEKAKRCRKPCSYKAGN